MGGQWNKTILAVNSSSEFWQQQREADVTDHVSDTSEQEKKGGARNGPNKPLRQRFCKGMWRSFHAWSTFWWHVNKFHPGKKTKQKDCEKCCIAASQLEHGNSWRYRGRHGYVSSPTYGAALATKIKSSQVDWPVLCNWRRGQHVGICKLSSRQSKPFIASGPASWSAVSLLPGRVNNGPHSEKHEVTETLRNILIMGSLWMFWGAKVVYSFDPQSAMWIICPV